MTASRRRRSPAYHAVDFALVRRLQGCYWPEDVFGVYTRDAVLRAVPEARFRDEAWRGKQDPDDLTYDLGRVHFFVRQLQRGARVRPIVVATQVYPTRGGSPCWGPPFIDDGHHRFAAAVLARIGKISMEFTGLLSTRDWLVGSRRRLPPELAGAVHV